MIKLWKMGKGSQWSLRVELSHLLQSTDHNFWITSPMLHSQNRKNMIVESIKIHIHRNGQLRFS